MGTLKNLDSTGIYAYTTLISCIICVPAALIMEGPYLKAAADKALESHPNFYMQLALVGLLYHLYNQAGAPFACTLAAATRLANLPAHQLCLPAGFCRGCPAAAPPIHAAGPHRPLCPAPAPRIR